MLVLERKGNEVFCEGRKLTIVTQASKGPNNEVVKVAGLEGSNGQQYVSLRKLHEGFNEIETQAHERVTKGYELTQEEKDEIAIYQSKIDAIIAEAKKRYVPHSNKKLNEMSIEELEAFIASKKAQLENRD